MNFLAHLYLSGDVVEIRLGNFIGDYVKGMNLKHYPLKIQTGIMLHRAIDSFTDSHPSTRICTKLLQPGYGKYAGVVNDIFYDHFLAKDWKTYSRSDLKSFTKLFYHQMLLRFNYLPATVRRFLPFMIHSDRLFRYRTVDGIKQAIEIMSSVSSLPSNSEYAIEVLKENYSVFNEQFHIFFPEIIEYVSSEYGIVIPETSSRI